MSWAIQHQDRRGLQSYWTGDDGTRRRIEFSLHVAQAARFGTEVEALTAYRGGTYRPTDSCCNAVEVLDEEESGG